MSREAPVLVRETELVRHEADTAWLYEYCWMLTSLLEKVSDHVNGPDAPRAMELFWRQLDRLLESMQFGADDGVIGGGTYNQ